MTFMHASLLFGLALAGIPIAIHLLNKKQPKPILFPALRFVRETIVVAERGWRVKHWLLLILRVLLVLLLALAFAAPRVHSAMLATYVCIGLVGFFAVFASVVALAAFASRKSRGIQAATVLVAIGLWTVMLVWGGYAMASGKAPPAPNANGPIAVAFIIDTSPTMGYRSSNESRMDVVKSMTKWLINRLPPDSQLAIVTSDQRPRLSNDRVTAERQLDRIEVQGKMASLGGLVTAAVQMVRASELDRREVYLLTDLMTNGWTDAEADKLQAAMQDQPEVLFQIIDVGVRSTQNWGIEKIQTSQQIVLPGGDLNVDAVVTASRDAPKEQMMVELYTEPIDRSLPIQRNGITSTPEPVLADRQLVELEGGQSRKVQFRLSDLKVGTHHITMKLTRPDPLLIDNEAYAVVEARTQGRILIVSEEPSLADFLAAIVAPDEVRRDVPNPTAKRILYNQLELESLHGIACVCLHDPPPMSVASIAALRRFAEDGGGVLISLGARNPNELALQTAPLTELLPGKPVRVRRRSQQDRSTFFEPVRLQHPVFNVFGQVRENVLWNAYPVYRFWELSPLSEGSSTIVRYTGSNLPAVVEQTIGKGKVITITTPIPEPAAPEGRMPWNELTSGTAIWPTYGLLKGAFEYLSGWGRYQLIYYVGEPVQLENDPNLHPNRYEVFAPANEVTRREAAGNGVTITNTRLPGHYRMRGLRLETPVVRGFAVNLADGATTLERIDREKLDGLFGPGNYHIARDQNEVETSVGQARYGKQLYPFLMVMALLILIAEQAMSSRFYSIRFSAKAARP